MKFDRSGDWFCVGCFAAVGVMELLDLSWGWVVFLGFLGGWALNEARRKEVEDRMARNDQRRSEGRLPYDDP